MILSPVMSQEVPTEEKPVAWFVKTEVKPEFRARYLASLRENLNLTRSEKAKPSLDVFQDVSAPDTFYQFESWPRASAHAEHLTLPHAVASATLRKEAAAKEPEVLRLTPYLVGQKEAARLPADPSNTENLVVVFKTNPQLRQEFLSIFDKLAPDARKAPGNLVFDLFQVEDQPDTFVLFERWQDSASYSRHLSQPYVAEFYRHLNAVVLKRDRHQGKDLSGAAVEAGR